jgi:hypothetical protein
MQAVEPKRRRASCCCGALEAEASGEPLVVAACSCEDCQRRTGSAFGVSTFWRKSDVTLSGEAHCYEREGQEGRKLSFYFCPKCGSTVYWENPTRLPDSIAIAYGAFFDRDFPGPTAWVFEKNKHPWISIPVEQHYEGNPATLPVRLP